MLSGRTDCRGIRLLPFPRLLPKREKAQERVTQERRAQVGLAVRGPIRSGQGGA